MDAYSKHLAVSTLRGQVCELELVSTLRLLDGSSFELKNVRRAVCKRVRRKGNITELEFADLDRAALDRVFPFETFTVADFPELYVDHVGWRVPQAIGRARKVPLAWVVKSGGVWRYAGLKPVGAAPTVLAVYRGQQRGQGALVSPTEYTVSTIKGAASGIEVVTVDFTREQIHFNGQPYVIEADFEQAGNRTPSNEVSRILTAFGLTPGAGFANAINADALAGWVVDALYGGGDEARTGKAILSDLCAIARAWLSQGTDGSWDIVQDVAKAATGEIDSAVHEVQIQEYGDGDAEREVIVEYFPRASNGEDFARSTTPRSTGVGQGERRISSRYISDDVVADKLACYWQKRLATLKTAIVIAHGVQVLDGERVTITDQVTWKGTKDFLATGINRSPDRNEITLREYDPAVYVYTAGPLPAGATNTYSPDYSFTPPAAPTGLAVPTQGVNTDADGKVTAFATIRAVPPVVNWQRLMVQVKDLSTGEIYGGQLRLSGGNYETVISGLRPGRNHEVIAWAVNSSNIDGAVTAAVAFTSASSPYVPGAPASVTPTQTQSFQVDVAWSRVVPIAGAPPIDFYVLEQKVGAGAFAEVFTGDALKCPPLSVSHGTAYQYRVKAVNRYGTEGAYTTSGSITPSKKVDDGYVINQGLSGNSIANGSINRGRSYTATGSAFATVGALGAASFELDVYAFCPNFWQDFFTKSYLAPRLTKAGAADTAGFQIYNTDSGSGETYEIDYRRFLA